MDKPRLAIVPILFLLTVGNLPAQGSRLKVGDPFPVQLFPQIGEKKLQSLARFA